METVLGIDLGTTNSVAAYLKDGQPHVLCADEDRTTLASVVGLGADGERIVGVAARNQALVAPERTVLSIKRRMGEDITVSLGSQEFTPQEVSAVILRSLKERAEQELGETITQAVITVPAFFNDLQRAATKQAGELAGLEVLRIINEPTAAALVYEPNDAARERLLVYDLGGGTFDVSIVQIEKGVVEVLSSHGDTHLGGDDFDRLLMDHVCDKFSQEHANVDLRDDPVSHSRVRQAVEAGKCRLSSEACTVIEQPFIAERGGKQLNLNVEIYRTAYEDLIQPLVQKTIDCVDKALDDAQILAKDIDKVILVGGSSRTPLVQEMLAEQLGQLPRMEFDPDLCVAMGAAIQGGLISGADVNRVLVDITPHTLGVRCLGWMDGMETNKCFSRLINRNTSLPATRSELYLTCVPGTERVLLDVYQGENDNTDFNEKIGSFWLNGLNQATNERGEILIRFDLDLDGTLKVTAIEKDTSLEENLTIDNAVTRFRASDATQAKQRLADLFGFVDQADDEESDLPEPIRERMRQAKQLFSKADRLVETASETDVAEIEQLGHELKAALDEKQEERADTLAEKLEDVLFYLEDA